MSTPDRSVVFVTVDSLRYDYCTDEHMPTLADMAENGIAFENAVAPGPSTSESMPAVFTGSYPTPRSDRVAFDERVNHVRPHLRTHRTIADRFADAGYRTAAFTPNPFTSRHFGFDSGFDHFEDFLDGSRSRLYDRVFSSVDDDSGPLWFALRTAANWLSREEAFKPWEEFYDDILAWVESDDDPYFLWIFLMDAHHPYLAGPGCRSQSRLQSYYANWRLRQCEYEPPLGDRTHKWLTTAYEDSVTHVDQFLTRLRADLADPVVVVTSDHGESFAEHGTYEHHGGALGNYGAQERNVYMYEENIHVPLVVANAGRTGEITAPVSLRALGRLLDPGGGGISVGPDLQTPYAISRTFDGSQTAVRGRDWKYVTYDEIETTYQLDTGGTNDERPVEAPDLRRTCREIVATRRRTEREQEQLTAMAKRVANREQASR